MRTVAALGMVALFYSTGIAQTRDVQAIQDLKALDAEVVKTAASTCDRIEFPHLVAYFDRGLLAPAAERAFGQRLEEGFTEVARLLERRFNPQERGKPKPDYYVTDRGGLSHALPTHIILRAKRVVPDGLSTAYHETVHLLVMHDPAAPRNRNDLSPEEDARATGNTGDWVFDGFADYVAFEVAAKLHVVPVDLFDEGKTQGEVDAHARKWLDDPRGLAVLPFVGSHGSPEGAMADRQNVAAPPCWATPSRTTSWADSGCRRRYACPRSRQTVSQLLKTISVSFTVSICRRCAVTG